MPAAAEARSEPPPIELRCVVDMTSRSKLDSSSPPGQQWREVLLGFRSRRCSAFPLSWHSTIRASLDRFGFFWRSRREKQQRRSQPPDKRVSEHLFRRFFF